MSDFEWELMLKDSEATDALGAALARTLPGTAADRNLGLYLTGDLGAGKSTCVRSLLRTLGVTGLIRSPTYTLIETYRVGMLTCVHVDLYRLNGPREVDELGLRDFLGPGFLLLVEWPEKAGHALPVADLELSLAYANGGRLGRLRARTEPGAAWRQNLRYDSSLTSYVFNLT
jgi:tRNA threonylcarbamoyladenosine biosynthesis protein TsaE